MVDPLMRLFANAVTYREKVEARQQMLHNKDEGARWFNLVRSADLKVTKLKVWDRFNQLCNISAEQDTPAPQSFPSLTSFVGGTHVGKSTLVRAMLLLGRAENANIGLEKNNISVHKRAAKAEGHS